MTAYFWGAASMAFTGAAIFFLRFWRQTADRFFALFAVAFLLLALNYGALGAIAPTHEERSLLYLLRLAAFLVILAAIVMKNRGRG